LEPALTYGVAPAGVGAGGHGGAEAIHEIAALAWGLMALSTAVALSAGFLGWRIYRRGPEAEAAFAGRRPWLYRLLAEKFYVDEAVEAVVLAPVRWFGNVLWKACDVILIDGLGVNLPGAVTRAGGDLAALVQTGRVRNYTLGMALGVVLVLWIFFR
jgi:NADH-quinone oxidoreductase subunit L